MTDRKNIRLPENWEKMYYFEKYIWFNKNFCIGEDDEGEMIYDTENMTEEVKKAYMEIVEYKRNAFEHGYLID